MQKVRKVSIFDKTCQTSSWAHLRSNLSINAYCNFTKKIRKVLNVNFTQNLKTSFWVHFVLFFPKTIFFQKKSFRSNLKLYTAAGSCENWGNCRIHKT